MKKYGFFLLILCIFGCTKQSVVSPEQLLEKVVENNGVDQLYSASVSFSIMDMNYASERDGNSYQYSMTRIKDTTTYKATAFNGGFTYTENDVEKSYGSQNGQVERQLIALNDFMTIPYIFLNDNSVSLERKTPVRIDGINYEVVHVQYNASLPTDLIKNYYLYIHEKEYSIDYIGYDFVGAEGKLFFRESFNRRSINGVTFTDYRTYRTKDNTAVLDSLPRLFLTNRLDLTAALSTENVQLKRNLKN